MKFLFVTPLAESASLVQKVQEEGHAVRFYIKDKKRALEDEDSYTLVYFCKALKIIRPRVFFFENVGMLISIVNTGRNSVSVSISYSS